MRETESVSSRCRVALARFRHRRFGRRPPPDRSRVHASSNIQLTHIFDRRAREKRRVARRRRRRWTSSIDDVLQSDVDVIVEAIGGVEPAAGWIRAALLAGKSVVTANKQVVARHGAGAADARRQAGAAAALRSRGRRRDADRARDRRRPGRRSHHAPGRDPERHDQRRAVADGGDRLRARRRGRARRAIVATPKRIRPPISTATTRAPSSPSCARSRSACASTRRRSTSDRRRRSARRISRARASAARRSARSRSRTTIAQASLLTAWVAPVEVERGVDLRAGRPGRRTRR